MKREYKHIAIEVTRRCNQQCADYCMRGPRQNLDISPHFIDLLLDPHRNNYKAIRTITFSGGEPTLNVPAITYTINKIISEKLPIFQVSLMTNGLIYSEELVEAFKEFNNYYNSHLLPLFPFIFSLKKKDICMDKFKNQGSFIGFSNDQYHKPIPNEVLNAYFSHKPYICYSMTGNRDAKDILQSGFSKQGRSLSSLNSDIRIFKDVVFDLIYLTAKGNLATHGDGSFDSLDEISQPFSILDYNLERFCFENLSSSSTVGGQKPVFLGKIKSLRKKV